MIISTPLSKLWKEWEWTPPPPPPPTLDIVEGEGRGKNLDGSLPFPPPPEFSERYDGLIFDDERVYESRSEEDR